MNDVFAFEKFLLFFFFSFYGSKEGKSSKRRVFSPDIILAYQRIPVIWGSQGLGKIYSVRTVSHIWSRFIFDIRFCPKAYMFSLIWVIFIWNKLELWHTKELRNLISGNKYENVGKGEKKDMYKRKEECDLLCTFHSVFLCSKVSTIFFYVFVLVWCTYKSKIGFEVKASFWIWF